MFYLFFFQIKDAIVSHGCFLRECIIEHSIVGERSRLDTGVELKVIIYFTQILFFFPGGLETCLIIEQFAL